MIDWAAAGREDAPVLVLGPSLGTRRSFLDGQVEAFRDRWRVIRFDLPGHGTSPRPAGPFTIDDVAGAIVAVLDGLGVAKFSYVGVSISGAIGLALALRHPERLDDLVLCSTAAHWPDQGQWRKRAARVRLEGVAFLVPGRVGTWFSEAYSRAEPAVASRMLADLAATDPRSYALCCDALRHFDARDHLCEITAPTLIIVGDQDPATPLALAAELHQGIPGSRLEVVDGGLHLLQLEHTDLVNTLIADHLNRSAAFSEGKP